ncbi:6-hydroxymethylpterin diphosphokinase MptE-like protein [Mediterraneibacter faecis]|jgi:hypothetical protein|uniref:6-hydroxymethylpterin diphosphokinase MptE-like protein n=1 Tax=Mediterraneibacter faecis TaxID=592978 RepID=UPI0022E6CC97|nr:6-hydroxymethylpterin diphosphokinase MptE-like protein [Mediterraneibacter faecis]
MNIKSFLHPIVVKAKESVDDMHQKKYLKTNDHFLMKKLKDTAQSTRCFVIGNGPSLSTTDLEVIQNEVTFASNRIYGLYERTSWRPTYYCSQDQKVLAQIKNDLSFAVSNCKQAFFPYNYKEIIGNNVCAMKNVHLFYKPYVSVYSEDGTYPEGLMPFSKDVSRQVYDGLSITYAMIQLAVYMGFKEIYLLGVDHNYPMKNGVVDTSQSYAEGIKPIDMSTQYPPELLLCEVSYREARRFCEDRKISIKNATRGGKLEVFERISLEEAIQNGK